MNILDLLLVTGGKIQDRVGSTPILPFLPKITPNSMSSFQFPLEKQMQTMNPLLKSVLGPITDAPGAIGENVRQVGRFSGLKPNVMDIATTPLMFMGGVKPVKKLGINEIDDAIDTIRGRLGTPEDQMTAIRDVSKFAQENLSPKEMKVANRSLTDLIESIIGKFTDPVVPKPSTGEVGGIDKWKKDSMWGKSIKTTATDTTFPIDQIGEGKTIHVRQSSVTEKGVLEKIKEIQNGGKPTVLVGHRPYMKEGQVGVLDGNHTLEAYKRLGIKDIPITDNSGGLLSSKTIASPSTGGEIGGINKFYHGTSAENAAKIQSEGFRTGVGKGISGQTSEDFIYATGNKNSAMSYVKDRLSIKNPTTVEGGFTGKVLDIPGKKWDFEAFGEASKKLGVPLLPDSRGNLTMLDIPAIKNAMKEQGYGAIQFSDIGKNGTKAMAIVPDNIKPSSGEIPKRTK